MCTTDRKLEPFRGLIALFAVFLVAVAGSAAVLFVLKLGGGVGRFYAPRTLPGLLDVAVPHLLAIPLSLFTTIHLVGWVGLVRPRPMALLSRAAFACALAGIAGGFAVRYVHPALATVKIAAFVGLESLLLIWLWLLCATVIRTRVDVEERLPAQTAARSA